jgi:hypothetical protein
VALDERIADEQDRSGRRLERFVVQRERGAPREHDVDLLVPERLLGVLLHDLVTRIRREVGVHAERADVERPAQGPPEKRAVDDGDRLDLVDADALPGVGHDAESTDGV